MWITGCYANGSLGTSSGSGDTRPIGMGLWLEFMCSRVVGWFACTQFCLLLTVFFIDSLQGSANFTKIDVRTGYHHIFKMRFWITITISFYLLVSPISYYFAADDEWPLSRLRGNFVADDTLIYSRTLDKHVEHLLIALEIHKRNGMWTNPSVSSFEKKSNILATRFPEMVSAWTMRGSKRYWIDRSFRLWGNIVCSLGFLSSYRMQ